MSLFPKFNFYADSANPEATPSKASKVSKLAAAVEAEGNRSAREDGLCPRDADQALALLNQLKCYTLPADRMPDARELAERMRGLADTAAILHALRDFERELRALGGEYDRALAEATAVVERVFPGARLVKFTQ
jgi:hypothetical protein